MTALDQLVDNDLVTNAVYDALALRPRRTARTGFISICCPMCLSRGETQDRKFRCGVIQGDGIGVNCFNCGFKSKFRVGDRLSISMRNFLGSLGVSRKDVQRLAYWADTMRSMLADRPDVQARVNVITNADFVPISLPTTARSLQHWVEMGCTDPNFVDTVEYLFSRGEAAINATTYYWTPEDGKHGLNRRLIIPCYHRDRLVGWLGRAIDGDLNPAYHKEVPSNYIFNANFLSVPNRKYVFIVEGAFDALAIDGVAPLGASLNDTQIAWIVQSGKQPVVVADRDRAGERLVKVALKHGWPVATMHYHLNRWWERDVKDSSEAAKRYGKLYTVRSILANLTSNPAQIRQRIKYHVE